MYRVSDVGNNVGMINICAALHIPCIEKPKDAKMRLIFPVLIREKINKFAHEW